MLINTQASYPEDIEARWLDVLRQLNLTDGRLLWESYYGPGRRTYTKDDHVYKLWYYDMVEFYNKYGDLSHEYKLLDSLKMKNTPRPLKYEKFEWGEMAVYKYIHGRTLNEIKPGLLRIHYVLCKVAMMLVRMSLKGLAHNDVQAHNVIIDKDGSIHLLDFDQARREHPLKALYHNLVSGGLGGLMGCYRRVVREYAKNMLQGFVGIFGFKLERINKHTPADDAGNRRFELDTPEPSELDRQTRQVLNLLRYTKTSNSAYSAQEFEAGYHSIKIGGRRFKGQRSPDDRLQAVPFDFKDRTALDIGCNQGGMLFELAGKLKHGIGIDYDSRMINAANRIKSATGAANLDFYVFDLENENLDRIQDFLPDAKVEIVFLLSVCMWIKNWRSVIDLCRAISPALLFESNGDDFQQQEQIAHLESRYNSVKLLQRQSTDDPRMRNRKLYICTTERVEDFTAENAEKRIGGLYIRPNQSYLSDKSDKLLP